MSKAYTLFQLCHSPSTNFLFGSSKSHRGSLSLSLSLSEITFFFNALKTFLIIWCAFILKTHFFYCISKSLIFLILHWNTFFSVMNKLLPWNINAGLYMIPGWKVYPTLHFCKNVQTTTYEVVNASYVPTAQTKEEKEIKVWIRYKDR